MRVTHQQSTGLSSSNRIYVHGLIPIGFSGLRGGLTEAKCHKDTAITLTVCISPKDPYLIKHEVLVYQLQVVPGRAGGGSFKRKKNYIAKKEFAYRMCAR